MDEVGHWLEGLGLGRYAATFAENDIEFDLLSELTHADLEKLGVSSLGQKISGPPTAARPLWFGRLSMPVE